MDKKGYILFDLLIAIFIMSLILELGGGNIQAIKSSLAIFMDHWTILSELHSSRETSKSTFSDTNHESFPYSSSIEISNTKGIGFTEFGHTKNPASITVSSLKKITVPIGFGQVKGNQ